VFQDYTLFPHMNVFDNVAYGLVAQRRSAEEIDGRVRELLNMISLEGFEDRRVQTLSGGEQQRVAIARALAIEPVALLLDEPFSSIDTILRKDLRKEIVRLQESLSISILFVTHNQEEALSISDRVVVMRDGEILQSGTPVSLYAAPNSRFVASFVGSANFITGRITGRHDSFWLLRGFALRPFRISGNEESLEGKITIMVRPECLRFAEENEENAFGLKILSRQFLAHYYEYQCESHGWLFTIYDSCRREPGETAHAAFRPEDAVVLRD
jgi:spermidine/putrescine transport system ATP-binding protein